MPYKDPEKRREAGRANYRRHKEAYVARKNAARQRIRRFLYDYLSKHPCVDCGESHPATLDFDHTDDRDRKFHICRASAEGYSIESIEQEIEKCVVRCANCHRKRTSKKQGWYEDLL